MTDYAIDPSLFSLTGDVGGFTMDNPFGLPAEFFDFSGYDPSMGGAIALGGVGGDQSLYTFPGTGGTDSSIPVTGQTGAGGVTNQPVNTTGGTGAGDQSGSANWVRIAGMGISALTAAFGLAGVVQALINGPPEVKQAIQKAVTQASPQEQAAFNQALQVVTTGTGPVAGTPQSINYGGGSVPLNPPTGAAGAIQRNQPVAEFMGNAGTSRLLNTNENLFGQYASTLPFLTGQVPGLGTQQAGLFNQAQAAAPSINPQIAQAIQMQALGMAQGGLPGLNPAVQSRVNDIYAGKMQDVNRYTDNAFQGALERARQQGFAGGPEVFREGTPGTILAPMMAEAVRQRGSLAGQQAEQEIALSLALPLLASQLEAQRIGTGVQASANLGNLGAQLSTPLALRLAGAGNIVGAGQNIGQALLGAGQQNTENQLNLARILLGISGQAQNERLGTASTNVTTSGGQNSLLGAFAPLMQVLGATGGILSGTSAGTKSGVA